MSNLSKLAGTVLQKNLFGQEGAEVEALNTYETRQPHIFSTSVLNFPAIAVQDGIVKTE